MNVSHHVNDDLLYMYAAGELDFGWNLAIATHLAMCSECRRRNALFEDVLAASLEKEDEVKVSVSVDDIIQQATNSPVSKEPKQIVFDARPVFPKPLRDVAGDFKDIEWSTMGGGIRQKIIHEENGVIARLLYIPENTAASSHGHSGMELTQVVMGGYYDGDKAFNCGDMQIVGHDGPHQPLAMADGPCVCLAVTDAPLKFENVLPRLFQRFFNI